MSRKIEGLKAVYTYGFPESRKVVDQVDTVLSGRGKRFYLTQTPVGEAREILAPLALSEELELPSKPDGTINLDAVHEPMIDAVVRGLRKDVPALAEYPYRYPTSGSSEGLFKYLTELRVRQGIERIYTLEGEYEGYAEYGKVLGIQTVAVNPDMADPSELERGIWFISNPSARDGNIIPNEKITALCEAGHQVVLDLAYVGSTREHAFDVSHPNIPVVFFSFSKPYGVFWERIGMTFSREERPSLFANKWFKDVRGLVIATNLMDKLGTNELYARYRPVQERIVFDIQKHAEVPIASADALLLGSVSPVETARLDKEQRDLLVEYKRGDRYRVCLTPYYEKVEKDR
jgi:hypothetical protein